MAAGRPGPSGATNKEGLESRAAQPMDQEQEAGDRATCYPPQSMACILSGKGKEQERSGAAEAIVQEEAGDRKPGDNKLRPFFGRRAIDEEEQEAGDRKPGDHKLRVGRRAIDEEEQEAGDRQGKEQERSGDT